LNKAKCWSVPDRRMLIRELIEHATQPQFIYTHQWSPGDLVI
jgi:alpha-ketoglutarate-dependent 2,4-dichlorophenoxyacetate dioxygenase